MTLPESETAREESGLSRRAARRLIQRALVLVGRERNLRQHLRAVHLTSLWRLDDWDFEWTVTLDRGKILFDRRPTKKPDVTVTWPEAEKFIEWAEKGSGADPQKVEGSLENSRTVEMVCRAFRKSLGDVLQFPFDDDGVRLV